MNASEAARKKNFSREQTLIVQHENVKNLFGIDGVPYNYQAILSTPKYGELFLAKFLEIERDYPEFAEFDWWKEARSYYFLD